MHSPARVSMSPDVAAGSDQALGRRPMAGGPG